MKLAIPKQVRTDVEELDGEYSMTMSDWCTLKRIMQGYDSFDHLEVYIKRGALDQRHKLRHVDVLEWLDDERYPTGCKLKDSFVAVLNIFGDEYAKKGVMPIGLPFDFVLAKGSDDMAVSERTFKGQLNSLIKGKYLDLSYGNVLFPAVRGDDPDKKA
jgi:hypothetical protein